MVNDLEIMQRVSKGAREQDETLSAWEQIRPREREREFQRATREQTAIFYSDDLLFII